MIEVSSLRIPLDAFASKANIEVALRDAAAQALHVEPGALSEIRLAKRSVDARKKADVHFVCTLVVGLVDPQEEDRLVASGAKLYKPYEPLAIPDLSSRVQAAFGDAEGALSAHEASEGENGAASTDATRFTRPLVVGAGPAGLFAALYLARAGLCPLLIERGPAVEDRVSAVAEFERTGHLDGEANIQFGEGGAGTFSDGKLTTNTKNPYTAHVLRWFVEAGAPEEILWQAKPHMGTDKLVGVVRSMREEIVRRGGEVRFSTRLDSLGFTDGVLETATLVDARTGEAEAVGAERVILACGHSARDTFAMLRDASVRMERKPFSVGVRIEHAQRAIDQAQYGRAAAHPALGAAEYKLSVHLPSGRGVYTFCMCPGGEVVCAASEAGGVVVNGMSRYARDGANANSALLVGVDPSDFPGDDVLAGVEFQREIERAAYRCAAAAGGAPYAAPAQTVGDFLAGKSGNPSATVKPTYARGVAWCDLRECLPDFVVDSLAEALPLLERKLHGFADGQAVMTGVETRSSSPVRIVRDGSFQALWSDGRNDAQAGSGAKYAAETGVSAGRTASGCGLYPCGEGAGYAGGIMSAAVDGLRVAEAVTAEIAGISERL